MRTNRQGNRDGVGARAPGRVWRGYVATMLALGLASSLYLTMGVPWSSWQQAARADLAPVDTSAYVRELEQAQVTVATIRSENELLRRAQADLAQKLEAEKRRVAALTEQRAEPPQTGAPVSVNDPSTNPSTAAAESDAEMRALQPALLNRPQTDGRGANDQAPQPQTVTEVRPGRVPPLPRRVPEAQRLALAAGGEPLTTGSIPRPQTVDSGIAPAPKPGERLPQAVPQQASPAPTPDSATSDRPVIAFGAPVVTASVPTETIAKPELPALRLTTAPSVDSLRLSWRVLRERNGGLLDGLEPRYRLVPSPSGPAFQLFAGPVASLEEADQLCRFLRQQNVNCAPDIHAGEAL
ncbi:MAG: hypothetical protein ACFCUN_00120 [Hyphomicrobiaceae bacterium]